MPARRKTRRERFLTVAPKRTQKILMQLDTLSSCANRATYAYEDSEVKSIFDAIEAATKCAKDRFRTNEGVDFEL